MTPLERHCGWLLRAYPAWYRRERAGEMLDTLLDASTPGRKWPSFRDTRALVTGGLQVRGWTWVLSVLWAGAGVVITGYFFYNTTKPFTWADVDTGIEGWSAAPVAVQIGVALAQVAFLALPLPVLIAGFVRLRGWQRGNWLRAAAWAGAWIAGASLMTQATVWAAYPEGSCPNSYQNGMVCPIPSPAVVSWGELAMVAAWPVLGAAMTWILAAPARRARSSLVSLNVAAEGVALAILLGVSNVLYSTTRRELMILAWLLVAAACAAGATRYIRRNVSYKGLRATPRTERR